MKLTAAALFLLLSIGYGQCPLGFTPDEACTADNPTCALFVDSDGDSFCDNPGPQTPVEQDTLQEIQTPPDTLEAAPDTSFTETVEVPDTTTAVTQQVDSTVPDVSPADQQVHETDQTADSSQEDFQPLHPEQIMVVSTEQGNQYCLSPRAETVAGLNCVLWELNRHLTDSSTITEGIQVQVSGDSVFIDTITVEEVTSQVSDCPLGYTPEEACPEESPSCLLYTDENQDLFCDNPGFLEDTTTSIRFDVAGVSYGLVRVESGCPLGLPPEAACPTVDNALCPHYMGFSGCTNPYGNGMTRTLVILIVTFLLLSFSTCLRRRFRGRRKDERKRRKIAHITVQLISLIVLGFIVQGCFCPLGVVQYALLPVGLIFLGILGVALLILPMIWSMFFDRVYCGWVCPFGALQDLLGKLNVPRPPKFPHRIHVVMSGFKYLLVLLFFGYLLLASSGQFQSLSPQALFCSIDPFHTIFSFFMVGSFTVAIITVVFLIFFPRFFCKYLCFYGAILSFLGRIGLWKRILRRHPRTCERSARED